MGVRWTCDIRMSFALVAEHVLGGDIETTRDPGQPADQSSAKRPNEPVELKWSGVMARTMRENGSCTTRQCC